MDAHSPRTALITGTTAGFGRAAARRFIAAGWQVIATGRRADRLDALRAELGDGLHPACFDVRDEAAMRAALVAKILSASLDDHRTWVDRLVAMARTTVTIGVSVLALMLSATVLTVVFATRGAMAGNGHIIEVLHFVGAEAGFIARQFRRHFLLTGMKGAAAGGLAAIVVFIVFSWWSSRNMATPQADQAAALFGNFAIGSLGYVGVVLMVLVIGALTAATSHVTVVAYLTDIDMRQPEAG